MTYFSSLSRGVSIRNGLLKNFFLEPRGHQRVAGGVSQQASQDLGRVQSAHAIAMGVRG